MISSTLAWKEYRETRMVWLTMAFLGVVTVFVAPPVVVAMELAPVGSTAPSVFYVLIILSVTYGLITGSMTLAGELESGAQRFLDILPIHRRSIWMTKLLVGLVGSVLLGFLLTATFELFKEEAVGDRAIPSYLLAVITVEAFVYGMLGSAFAWSTMASLGGSLGFYILAWMISGLLGSAGGTVTMALGRVVLLAPALLVSLGVYVHYTATHQRAKARSARAREKPITERGTTAVLLWLVQRQSTKLLLITMLCCAGLGLLLRTLSHFWPMITLMLGVIVGSQVWAGEQHRGTYRFLSFQRLSPGRVWSIKTGYWFLGGVSCCAVYFTVWYFKARWSDLRPSSIQEMTLVNIFGATRLSTGGLWLYITLWYLYGFTAGQLFSMLWQKTVVALVLSFLVSLIFLGPWVPSLTIGDLPVWQPLVAPVVLLLTSRVLYWAWITGQIQSRKSVVTLTVAHLAIATMVSGCLWARVAAVPGADPPFDVEALNAELSANPRNEASARFQIVLSSLTRGSEVPQEARDASWLEFPEVGEPWALRPEDYAPAVETMSEHEWYKELQKTRDIPLGHLLDPVRTLDPPAIYKQGVPMMTRLLTARMQWLAARQRYAELSDLLHLQLKMVRHLAHQAPLRPMTWARGAEKMTLLNLESILRETTLDSGIRSKLEVILSHHVSEMSSYEEAIRVSYLGEWIRLENRLTRERQRWGVRALLAREGLFLAFQIPWEEARAKRWINLVYRKSLESQEALEAVEWPEWMRQQYIDALFPWRVWEAERQAQIEKVRKMLAHSASP